MTRTEKLRNQFYQITAEADKLSVPEVDEKAIEIDLLLKYKERCKRDARNFARKGCFQKQVRKQKNYYRPGSQLMEMWLTSIQEEGRKKVWDVS